jgi:hypothetical protein
VPHPSGADDSYSYQSAPVSNDLSPAKAPSFEEGEIRDDESDAMQSADQKDNGKSGAAPLPSAFNAPNQLASASKRLSPANLQSKVDQSAFNDNLETMRMNATNMDKVRKETGISARIRTPIKKVNEIDLNSTPNEWLVSNSNTDVTHYLAFAQPNLSNLGQLPANANTQQPLLLEPGQSSRGVDKRKRAEGEDDNEM